MDSLYFNATAPLDGDQQQKIWPEVVTRALTSSTSDNDAQPPFRSISASNIQRELETKTDCMAHVKNGTDMDGTSHGDKVSVKLKIGGPT